MDNVHYMPPRGHAHTARGPLGEATRGKTAPNRLRRVDTFVLLYARELIAMRNAVGGPASPRSADSCYVDLGYGETPTTTLESARRFRQVNPELSVLGVEIDRERVAAAERYADDRTHFRYGGFNLPLRTGQDGRPEAVRLIRCMNVLRQYDEAAVEAAWSNLARTLLPGGLLIEGTSSPNGGLFVANLLRAAPAGQDPSLYEGLVFSSNLRRAVDPAELTAVLPKNLIHRIIPGEPIHAFFEDWQRAYRFSRGDAVWGVRWMWRETIRRLAEDGYAMDLRPALVERGYLVLKGGSYARER